jgi:hypothetical protein
VQVGSRSRNDNNPGEGRVEGCGELTVPAADQEPEPARPLAEVYEQAGGLPGRLRVRWISITRSTCTRRSGSVSTCRKWHASSAGARAARNCRHAGDARRGAGPMTQAMCDVRRDAQAEQPPRLGVSAKCGVEPLLGQGVRSTRPPPPAATIPSWTLSSCGCTPRPPAAAAARSHCARRTWTPTSAWSCYARRARRSAGSRSRPP